MQNHIPAHELVRTGVVVNREFRPIAVLSRLLLAFVLSGGCTDRGSNASQEKAPEGHSGAAATATAAAATPPGAADGHGPIIDGERFTVRKIIDAQQQGIVVGVFVAPEKWRDQSQVVWSYGQTSNPVEISMSIENPANEEAVFGYPAAQLFCLRPDAGFYRSGQNVGGLIYMQQQMEAAQALRAFVQQARGNAPKLQLIGTKYLPDLPAALGVPPSPNQKGVGLKIAYELNGKPVEEEFYGVFYSVEIPYDGPRGRTWQINWGLNALHSFRAPEGTLDARRAVFAAVAKSFRPNPAWQQRLGAINAYLQEQFNRQLKAGYDQIAAAAALSRQISANNDAMLAAIDRQLAASRTASARSSGAAEQGHSASDRFDDYIRGVETVDDPYYGTSQHSYDEQYHWTDGYGSYRHSNDTGYNPNEHEKGDWQLMPPTR